MPMVNEHRSLIIDLVMVVLWKVDPAESEVYSLVAEDVVDASLKQRRSRGDVGGDGLAAFEGLSLSLGEILTGVLVAISSDILKAGVAVTKDRILARIRARKKAGGEEKGVADERFESALRILEENLEGESTKKENPKQGVPS